MRRYVMRMDEMSPEQIEQILRELGRLVFNFNALEQSLRNIVESLVGEDVLIAAILIRGADCRRLEELARSLIEGRPMEDQLRADLFTMVKEVSRLREARSSLLHGVWTIPNDAADLSDLAARRPPGGRRREWQHLEASQDAAKIALVASQCSQASEKLEGLWKTILNSRPATA